MRRPSGLKIAALMLCGVLLVLLFSRFAVQGIFLPIRVIGASMAETFWGPHYTIWCKNCQFCFVVDAATVPPQRFTNCPNCGSQNEHKANERVIAGDRLLVDQMSYQFRDPGRWETILFRSTDPPIAHCLKRVVGLPNENVSIADGDIWINEERLKKDWSTLDSLALVVHDARYVSQQPRSPPRWRPQYDQTQWKKNAQGNQGFEYFPCTQSTDQVAPIDWIVYKHVDFHHGRLRVTNQITDNYAYNQTLSRKLYWTDDLILSANIQCFGSGSLFFQVGTCRLQIDCSQGLGILRESGREVATFDCKIKKLRAPVRIEVASVDRRFFFVIDREVIFSCDLEAQPAQPIAHTTKVSTEPAGSIGELRDARLAVGSQSLRVTVDDLLVRRDIYYTPDIQGILASRVGDYHLGKEEFFVLGDNSPVSLDSRRDMDEAIVRRVDVLGRVWRWR